VGSGTEGESGNAEDLLDFIIYLALFLNIAASDIYNLLLSNVSPVKELTKSPRYLHIRFFPQTEHVMKTAKQITTTKLTTLLSLCMYILNFLRIKGS